MTTETISKRTKEDFGYSSSEERLMYKYNPSIPKGSFSIQKRNGKYYWYYQLGVKKLGEKTRVKYLCPTFEGLDNEGNNSFQVSFTKLVEKVDTNFQRTSSNNTKLITLCDEYIRELLIEENDPNGIRKYETTQSIRNGVMRFREFCLMRDLRLSDCFDVRKLKGEVKEYLDYCIGRKLSRNTRRIYLKQTKYFFDWLSDEDVGKGIIPSNPISTDFIKKIHPFNPNEKQGLPRRNYLYKSEYYDEMFGICIHKVGELWREFLEEGLSRPHRNQPIGIGSDVVYFITLFQLDSGFRMGEILTSYRNTEYWNNRRDKKNSSTYWEKINGDWYLRIWWKNKESVVPITTKIRSWVKPIGVEVKPTKDKKGKILYWDTPLVDVCMSMFRESSFLFSSPNYRTHRDTHYSKTYYSNLVKQILVNKGVGGEGWESYGIRSSHHFRSYFITHKIGSGMKIQDVSRLSRNSIQTISRHYERMDIEKQLDRQKQLDKTRKVKPKKELK
jgi:hypothetical protein